ncbi:MULTISPECIES: RES family NAD+ phosphorylase [Sphingobacterium]|uniref:RES family NAD+ phosphorylase n=1 Tax=Sphingobacterium TaxID=28453 RepID=UPI0013DCA89B|nr:RES family NAD+ phosphorylase [Sphingobacterium sp. xlx-96]
MMGLLEVGERIKYTPYTSSEISSPPSYLARKGRMNREGFSFLYLAEDIETAINEIRPNPGDIISVGGFRQN